MPLRLKRYPKRSEHWYIRGSVRGQPVFETTGTHDRAAAEAYRIKRESELLNRSIFGAGATISFLEAAVSYLEAGGEAHYLGKKDDKSGRWSLLIGHFGTKPIAAIGQPEADEAAAKLYPNAGNATRKRHAYVPICAVLNHAAEKWELRLKKIKHPQVKTPPVQWAPPENVRKLLPACSPALRRFVMVIVYTGARLSEALRVEWENDVDLEHRTLSLGRTKNGELRTAHIPDPLYEELSSVPKKLRTGPMFHWSHKSHVHRPLRTACKKAGVPYLSPHKLGRHTYATWLRRYAHRDLRGLMEDGGWKSVNSVLRYAHVVPGETAVAVDKLPSVQCSRRRKAKRPTKQEKPASRRSSGDSLN